MILQNFIDKKVIFVVEPSLHVIILRLECFKLCNANKITRKMSQTNRKDYAYVTVESEGKFWFV